MKAIAALVCMSDNNLSIQYEIDRLVLAMQKAEREAMTGYFYMLGGPAQFGGRVASRHSGFHMQWWADGNGDRLAGIVWEIDHKQPSINLDLYPPERVAEMYERGEWERNKVWGPGEGVAASGEPSDG